MRLITHNLLQCNVKNCIGGYPLQIDKDAQITREDNEINRELVEKMLQRIDYSVLHLTATSIGIDIPSSYNSESDLSEDFINVVGDAIFNVSVKEGKLICPSCSHVFTIKNGIPNMVLKD